MPNFAPTKNLIQLMGRSQETAAKKEKEKKKARKKQDKAEKMQERKANNNKGKSLDDMLMYLDENGNLSDSPPDPKKMKEINAADIIIDVAQANAVNPADLIRKGVITFFSEGKGYGFINDLKSQQSIFVHINNMEDVLKERDKVTFEIEPGPKGPVAVRVKKAV